MKKFLCILALVMATLLMAGPSLFAQGGPIPPVAPPVRIGLTVGGQGLGIDITNKRVTVPADWTVVVSNERPKSTAVLPTVAPPVTYYAAPVVAAPVPFGVVTTGPVMTARPVAGSVQQRSRSFQAGFTRTSAYVTEPSGGIMTLQPFGAGGCANGQCSSPQFAPFGGFFRR